MKNKFDFFERDLLYECLFVKELERELSQILNLSIQNCTTIASKLRLLEVFEGVHERDVIQVSLK